MLVFIAFRTASLTDHTLASHDALGLAGSLVHTLEEHLERAAASAIPPGISRVCRACSSALLFRVARILRRGGEGQEAGVDRAGVGGDVLGRAVVAAE